MSTSHTSGSIGLVSSEGADATDIATDEYGTMVAVAFSTGKVCIGEVSSGTELHSYMAHPGVTITRVTWAAAKFGNVLATSAIDGSVTVWKLALPSKAATPVTATPLIQRAASGIAVHSIDWGPQEFGLNLAVAGGDGKVYMLTAADAAASSSAWQTSSIDAHAGGCFSVSWLPCLGPSWLTIIPLTAQAQTHTAHNGVQVPPPRIATSGLERTVKIWRFSHLDKSWVQDTELTQLSTVSQAYVRDVAAACHHGLPFAYIAAGTDDGVVAIWRQDGLDGKWLCTTLPQAFPSPVCRVTWSSAGTFLCVNCADGQSTLWKEDRLGEWQLVHNGLR